MILPIFAENHPHVKQTYPLSSNQERYVLASLASTANYHLPVSFRLRGSLDIQRLMRSIRTVVRSHTILNASICRMPDGTFVNRVDDQALPQIESLEARGVNLGTLKRLADKFIFQSTSILKDHLCRFQIVEIGDDEYCFTLSLHHAIADGVTIGLFMEELSKRYNEDACRTAEQPVDSSYFELVEKYGLSPGEWSEEEETFWIDRLSASHNIALLTRDYDDTGRPDKQTLVRTIAAETFANIRRQAAALGVSPFQFVYGGYVITVGRYVGADEVFSSFQSSGRRGKPDARHALGPFSNAIPLKAVLDADQPFSDFACRLRESVHESVDHERYPYHEIIKQTGIHPTYGINWYPCYESLRFDDVHVEPLELLTWQSDYELNLHCLTNEEQLTLKLHYDSEKFDATRMSLFLEQLEGVLNQLAIDPQTRLSNVKLQTNVDNRLPNPKQSLPRDDHQAGLVDRFFDQSTIHSDRIALIHDEISTTYGQLAKQVRDVTESFRSHGIRPRAKIAILAHRNSALVISMLASLNCDCPFAVLDAEYPPDRLAQFFRVLEPDVLIVASGGPSQACQLQAPLKLAVDSQGGVRWLDHHVETPDTAENSEANERVAYYLFTSGTTGTPRCVLHAQEPLLHFIDWHIEQHGFDENTRFALTSGLSHDPMMRDVFTPLLSGASCSIPSDGMMKRPDQLEKWLRAHRINVLHATPQVTKMIAMATGNKTPLADLRYLFWGGDALDRNHATSFLSMAPNAQGVNFYGATETPQAAGKYYVNDESSYPRVPIGSGIEGTQLLVLSPQRTRCGYGEIGEIAVRTHHLSLGYSDGSLDDQKYIPMETEVEIGPNVAYLTGDFGYYLPSGDVYFLGRRDHQVKIRGFRVELDEVVSVIESHEGVARALVTPMARANGEQALVAYYVRSAEDATERTSIDNHVAARLPDYMRPVAYVQIVEIPLTPNGKVDYTQLPAPDASHSIGAKPFVAPATELERRLADEFQQFLGVDSIGADSSFAALGGDSLSYIGASMVIEEILGELPDHWETLTIRQLSTMKQSRGLFASIEIPVLIRAVAICAVVSGHFGLHSFHGATAPLFLVAGHSFGRFQLNAVKTTGSINSIFWLIVKVALPTMVYSLLVHLVGGCFYLPSILMVDNLISPHVDFTFWFVAVLLQNLLIFAAILAVPSFRRRITAHPFASGVVVLLICYALRVLFPFVWDTGPLFDRVPHIHLWLMALGWCVACANTQRRVAIAAVAALCCVICEWSLVGDLPLLLALAAILILARQRIHVPFFTNRLINTIAASSLFIYLTHAETRTLVRRLGFGDYLALQFGLAILVGVMCFYGWELLVKLFHRATIFRLNSNRDQWAMALTRMLHLSDAGHKLRPSAALKAWELVARKQRSRG